MKRTTFVGLAALLSAACSSSSNGGSPAVDGGAHADAGLAGKDGGAGSDSGSFQGSQDGGLDSGNASSIDSGNNGGTSDAATGPHGGSDGGTSSCGAGTTAPPQAIAAGYSDLVFCSGPTWDISADGTGDHQWYANTFFGTSTTEYNVDAGILEITGDPSGYGLDIATYSSQSGATNHAWQRAYFEAIDSFDPMHCPNGGGSFWSWAEEGIQDNRTEWAELDFFEGYGTNAETPAFTIHDWTQGSSGMTGPQNSNNTPTLPSGTDFTKFNKYGCLWVEGKVTWYFNDQAVTSVSWNPGGTYSILDSDHMVAIFGSGNGCPMKIQSMRVWQ